jgi:PAS domain S-box-containing protein
MAMTLSEKRRIKNMEALAGGGESTPIVEEVYRLPVKLHRAITLNDTYEVALDTITRTLGCNRASILLFDDAGIMRFAAWRGLSDAFRRAVEGHSPWTRAVKDPHPVCVQNVGAENLPEFLKDSMEAEQIKALALFPLVANDAVIGQFETYYDARQVLNKTKLALALAIAHQLGLSLERRRTEEALRETQRQLVSELAATRQLQKISTQLIHANDVEALYEEILDAAVTIMGSDFASMQMFHPERGELQLLAHRGFDPSSVAFWQWVQPGAGCICGAALRSGERAIVSDVECCDFMAGTENLAAYRVAGMRAMQSTPLVSRTGRLLGMISTHWRKLHQPSERDLRLLDVLARQAADLIERKQSELTDQRLAAIVDSSHDAIVSKDLDGLITTWNRGAERLFGYSASEMIGRSITILIPPDRDQEEVRILSRIRRNKRVDPYETVRKRKDGSLVDVSISVSPLRNAAGEVVGASKIARDIAARKRAEEQQRALHAELDHRVKNVLATVSAVVAHTKGASRSMDDFVAAVERRIQSMASTHQLLSRSRWQGVPLRELLGRELAPYTSTSNTCTEGPEVILRPEAAQTTASVLHELTTNAAKYGALSRRAGRVSVRWYRTANGPGPGPLAIEWLETGGPLVEVPLNSGYGRTVITELVPYELGGTARLQFSPEGVQYRLEIPAKWLAPPANNDRRAKSRTRNGGLRHEENNHSPHRTGGTAAESPEEPGDPTPGRNERRAPRA